MKPNPLLSKLGFSSKDRVLIFHADDIGMCSASVDAYIDLLSSGYISSASAMVPCPWFPQIASFCRESKDDRIDMGVHLTLTSEWKNYRWRPISTNDISSGLIDEDGYFFKSSAQVQEKANPFMVKREIEAQVECAILSGIEVTHIDSHMGTLFHPKFLPDYLRTAIKYKVPALMLRYDENKLKEIGFDQETALLLTEQIEALENEGIPLLDEVFLMRSESCETHLEQVKGVLDSLKPGITYFIIHPSKNTPELQMITEGWFSRVADYQTFMNEELNNYTKKLGIQVIGWKVIREIMRKEIK